MSIFRLIDYYFHNNIKSKSLKRKQDINQDIFNKVVNRSCLVNVSKQQQNTTIKSILILTHALC